MIDEKIFETTTDSVLKQIDGLKVGAIVKFDYSGSLLASFRSVLDIELKKKKLKAKTKVVNGELYAKILPRF